MPAPLPYDGDLRDGVIPDGNPGPQMNDVRDSSRSIRSPDRETVAAVIVAHNSGPDLLAAVRAVRQAGADEVVVVDNASHDTMVDAVEREFPDVQVLRTTANRGFAHGCNLGAEVSAASKLLFLNPDTLLNEQTLTVLAGYLSDHPMVGIVGPRLEHSDGALQPSAFRVPSPATETVRMLGLADLVPRKLIGGTTWFVRLLPATGHFETGRQVREVDFVTGACLMIRRDTWTAIGGFDERFFLYYEEIDLCVRAKRSGRVTVHVPTVAAQHRIGGSTPARSRAAWVSRHLSRIRFHSLHGTRGQVAWMRAIATVSVATRWLAETLRGLVVSRAPADLSARDCRRVLAIVMGLRGQPTPAAMASWFRHD
jgi:hypothetical protein